MSESHGVSRVGSDSARVGVVIYRVSPERLEGRWIANAPGYEGRTGLEIAVRRAGPGNAPAGSYDVSIWMPGENPKDPAGFVGSLEISPISAPSEELSSYRLSWTERGKPSYSGLGLLRAGSNELSASYWQNPRAVSVDSGNRHPAVMFEILARQQQPLLDFYHALFGWVYERGTAEFAYVRFTGSPTPLLGGIGQARAGEPGYGPGRNFYLRVDDLRATLKRAEELGGATYVAPVSVDGYHFAMFKDPEGNVVGLIEPFQ